MTNLPATDLEFDAFMAEFRATYRDGAASPKHAELAQKIVDRMLERHNRFRSAEHKMEEVKKFEVTHREGYPQTYVIVETGMVGDEGSMASIFCRDYRHIVIGKNGGVTLLNPKNKKFARGWFQAIHALTK